MDPVSAGNSPSDQGQREAFLDELSQFLSDRGRYLCRSPNLAGRVVDLHDLYNKVTSTGGYQKVTERGFWEDFLDVYGYPAISTTLAYGLQKIYQLYLEEYEKVHYFGDDEPQPFSRSFPGGYRRYRYHISAHQRMQANMNLLKPKISNYDRVVFSLESCLPNEVDFAVNACTLLSGESRHVLKLPQCKRIVDALLLHAGIVSDGHDSYDEVLQELQVKTQHDYVKFWKYSVAKKSVLPILLPDRLNKPSGSIRCGSECGTSTSDVQGNSDTCVSDFSDRLHERLENVYDAQEGNSKSLCGGDVCERNKSWSELFHGDRSLGVEDYEGQRVLQIALVLLNLSFEDFNVTLLARHPSLVCFVFLCIHSEYSCLRQTGLDILSNISSHMQLLHFDYDIVTMMFETINSAILSNDKFERVRGFEILGNICRPRPNLDYVCAHVSDGIYDAAIQNLLVTDVELLVAAIEALYRLSKLGEHTCTKILFVKGCTSILTNLVSLNVRIFGPEKLSEIRLARKIVPGQTNVTHPSPQPLPSYQLPPAPSPHLQHAVTPRLAVIHQPQHKLGSVQQSQPAIAAIVKNPSPAVTPSPILPQSKSRISSQPQPTVVPPTTKPLQLPINHRKVEQRPTSQPVVTTSQSESQRCDPPVAVKPKVSSPPPPASTPPATPVTSRNVSPPGVGPTYTHSEVGTTPPVFHYMPAPPNDIVQDSSPESFTKLWIWATYEVEPESYIPRVDVYCEYLASSNRYGRQGKAEILSATDFGKCLKQIFPFASSRLFNQGRGQPQYHIAGIRKRATLLPVPGYQLKSTSSVFSSEQEYEKIPVTQQSSATKVVAPSVVTQPVATQVSTVSVPIQQLQFQPVLVVSTLPGSNNVALVPETSTVNSKLVCQPCSITTNAVTSVAPVTLPVQTTSSASGASICSVSLKSDSDKPSSALSHANESVTEPSTKDKVTDQRDSDLQSNNVESKDRTKCSVNADPTSNSDAATTPSNSAHTAPTADVVAVDPGKSPPETDGRDGTVVENGDGGVCSKENTLSDKSVIEVSIEKDTSSIAASEKDRTPVFNGSSTISSSSIAVNHHPNVSNGFPEEETMEKMLSTRLSSTNKASEQQSKVIKRRKSQSKSTDQIMSNTEASAPLVNGFLEVDGELEDSKTKHENGSKVVDVMNGETQAAVNSILVESNSDINEIIKMDVDPSKDIPSEKSVTDKTDIPDSQVGLDDTNQHTHVRSNPMLIDEVSKTDNVGQLISDSTTCTGRNDSATGRSEATVNPEPKTSISNVDCDGTPTEQPTDLNPTLNANSTNATGNAEPSTPHVKPTSDATNDVTTTPSNPIPHSTLNQRLKDTITRRRSAHATPTPLPANHLPPSVLQQYSYKQDGLAQQIINVAPHQFQQHQFHQYRHPTSVSAQAIPAVQSTPQVTKKRAATGLVDSAPPVKVPRPILPTIASTPAANVPQSHVHQHVTRHPSPAMTHRPLPQPPHHIPPTPGSSASSNPQTHQGKSKPPTIDLMAPNASLLVLYRNVGKIPFADYTDEKEDAITKSVRLTASLILKNLAKYSNLGRSMVQKHEDVLACVAMSQMDCSPVVAKLLSELNV